MAGVDTITKEILQDAENESAKIIHEAEAEAESIRNTATAEAEKKKSDMADKAEKDAASYADRIQSQIGMRRKQAILGARQEMIREVLDQAYHQLDTQDDASYFGMIEKLAEENVQPDDGEILFTAKDAARLPEGFAVKLQDIAVKHGGSLKVSDERADVENGFILRYGGIEENCSLRALFSAKQEELQDEVHRSLF